MYTKKINSYLGQSGSFRKQPFPIAVQLGSVTKLIDNICLEKLCIKQSWKPSLSVLSKTNILRNITIAS